MMGELDFGRLKLGVFYHMVTRFFSLLSNHGWGKKRDGVGDECRQKMKRWRMATHFFSFFLSDEDLFLLLTQIAHTKKKEGKRNGGKV
jgi:hypothetical protein